MTETDDWEPELPPVLIIMGIKVVSTSEAASALSNEEMITPVNVADSIISSSQGMRFL